MRFVKGLDLLVVVEGTAILKIYSAGPHKVGQIEPAIAMRKLMIDTKRSTRGAAPQGKSRGGGASARGKGALATGVGTEVGRRVSCGSSADGRRPFAMLLFSQRSGVPNQPVNT